MTLCAAVALLGCDEVVEVKTSPLELNLDACLSLLNLSQPDQSCARGAGQEPKGCFLIEGPNDRASAVPVIWTLEENLRVAEGGNAALETAISELSEAPTQGALVFFAEGATFDCQAQTLEEGCEGDCVMKTRFLLKEERFGYAGIVPGVVEGDEGASCEWLHGEALSAATDERCDGVDNDCDGLVDEEFNVGEVCSDGGLGVCRREGVTACDDEGQARCMYEREPVEPSEERCDGADNDCDGTTDEELREEGQRCEPALGEGLSEASATYVCREGALICPVEERCDGEDNDVDGLIDEGFAVDEVCEPVQDGCNSSGGRVQCVTLELLEMQLGELGEAACVADRVMVGIEGLDNCDGVDQDCDGFIDEGYLEAQVSCGSGACLNPDGRKRCVDGVEVEDCAPLDNVSADLNCDGVDNDCDSLIDEGFISYLYPCEGLRGECARATRVYCVNNEEQQTCPEVVPSVTVDLRCDGLDEDCDGAVDESYVLRETSCGLGVCRRTTVSSCQGGEENLNCEPGLPLDGERDEDCDGLDDDCDGRVDEGYTPRVYTCFTGICAQSFSTRCEVSAEGSNEVEECPASSLIQPQVERCDGLDNDCNGVIDDNAYVPVNTTCGLGECVATGVEACVAGVIFDSCTPSTPAEGVIDDCDGADNDCDGQIDEAFVSVEVTCEGAVECAEPGATICVAGQVSDTCSAVIDLSDPEDACDGLDQDCDGEVDEGYVGQETSCGEGLCASTGVTFCQLGVEGDSCQPGTPTADTSCDGFDQDCDGEVDEGYATTSILCGQGECLNSGLRTCVAGEEQTSCTPLEPTPDENCNSKDDDCDGFVDEGYGVSAITCGLGVCERAGTRVCTASGVQQNCTEGSPTGPDTSCDGVDQDCDGVMDEGYVGPEVVCGLGVCENQTRASCVDGVVQQQCEPLDNASPDVSCNQVDEDCDGTLDEGFVGQVEQCGEGACEPTAQQRCTQAGVVSTCSYQNNPVDQTCNGVDEDCDGDIDEDYVAPATNETCGLGVCEVNASIQCLQGSAQIICVPGDPQGADDQCDGVDQDCDGQVDEGFSETLTCGLGICERTVTVGCDGACVEGEAGAEVCGDGLDNDCDGGADEGFEDLGTPCTVGVGACERTGAYRCKPQDLTAPLECNVVPGVGTVDVCDGLDNDCDGSVDEETSSDIVCIVHDPQGVLAGTSCERGQLQCQGSAQVCVGDYAPNELEEDYCTTIDEDCDSTTPALLNTSEKLDNVHYLGEVYNDVKLGDKCGKVNGKDCKWKCIGGVEFACHRHPNSYCTPD